MLSEIFNRLDQDFHALRISTFNTKSADFFSRNGISHSNIRCQYPLLCKSSKYCGYYLDECVSDTLRRIEVVRFPIDSTWSESYLYIEKTLHSDDGPIMGYSARIRPDESFQIDLQSWDDNVMMSATLSRTGPTGPLQLMGVYDTCIPWGIRHAELNNTPSDEILRRIITNELFNLKKIDKGIYAYAM